MRCANGAFVAVRSFAASEKRSLIRSEVCSGVMASDVEEDFSEPVLPGAGQSDYERYLRTDELLALQKTPEEMAHRDELLFQTVHQSSELWLKLACFEVEEATRLIRAGDLDAALRLLRRANDCMRYVTSFLEHLEQMRS